jgi:hypothetical protein
MKINFLPRLIIVLSLFLTSCQSCSTYTINERSYVNVVFDNSKLQSTIVKEFIDIDSIKYAKVPESIKLKFLNLPDYNEHARLVFFPKYPNEAYLIGFEMSPCWVIHLYNANIYHKVISNKEMLNAHEQKRIQDIFRKELFDKIDRYVIDKHIPDSVAFEK